MLAFVLVMLAVVFGASLASAHKATPPGELLAVNLGGPLFGHWGYIDAKGKDVIAMRFEDPGPFLKDWPLSGLAVSMASSI